MVYTRRSRRRARAWRQSTFSRPGPDSGAPTAPSFAVLASVMYSFCGRTSYAQDDNATISSSQVQQGFEISPVPKDKLNLAGKDPATVGRGSYLVNAVGDCSGCHSFPQYLTNGDEAGSNPDAGDPFEGTPSTQSVTHQLVANFNVSHYLAGGQCFGPLDCAVRNIRQADRHLRIRVVSVFLQKVAD